MAQLVDETEAETPPKSSSEMTCLIGLQEPRVPRTEILRSIITFVLVDSPSPSGTYTANKCRETKQILPLLGCPNLDATKLDLGPLKVISRMHKSP